MGPSVAPATCRSAEGMSEAGGRAALGWPATTTEQPETSSSAAVASRATVARRREEAGMSLGSSHCGGPPAGGPRSALVHEPDGAQRRDGEGGRVGLAVPGLLDGL